MHLSIPRAITTAALALVSASFANAQTFTDHDAIKLQHQMKGRWKSIACELRPQSGKPGEPVQSSWVTRDFTFDGSGKFNLPNKEKFLAHERIQFQWAC